MADTGTATSGKVLQGGGTGSSPIFSTATYPATATSTGTILRADGTNWSATTTTYPNTNALNTILYASSANIMAALATAVNGVLITDGTTGIPSISSTLPSAVQGNITSVGTIASGTWNGTAIDVAHGGTGRATLTNHGVLIGAATTAITQLAAGSTGQVLQSGGASADPVYSTATYPSATVGTGKVLYDNGTNFVTSVPTFPAGASATTRKITVSDGTNWVASTETWAVPGTSGNLLMSDGTNWTSAAPATAGAIQFSQVNISSANFKNSFSVPIVIVSAPSAGLILIPIAWIFKLNYGGTNAFTAGGTPSIFYTTVGATNGRIAVASSNAAFIGTATSYSQSQILPSSLTTIDPTANSISYQTTTSNPTGNAAGNNTVTVGVWYTTSVAIT